MWIVVRTVTPAVISFLSYIPSSQFQVEFINNWIRVTYRQRPHKTWTVNLPSQDGHRLMTLYILLEVLNN